MELTLKGWKLPALTHIQISGATPRPLRLPDLFWKETPEVGKEAVRSWKEPCLTAPRDYTTFPTYRLLPQESSLEWKHDEGAIQQPML